MSMDETYAQLAQRESALWGEAKHDQPTSWLQSPLIYRYVNRRVSGHPDVDCLKFIRQKYFQTPASLGLNVGCGHGELERLILENELAETMHGFDISSGAVERAKQEAEAHGVASRVNYMVADANHLDESSLAEQYDVIYAFMALHHMAHLDECMDGLFNRLKPGGLLIANEFIGPYRFQWTDKQLDIATRVLKCFPMEHTRDLRDPELLKRMATRPTLCYMVNRMAFESICSHKIMGALHSRFEILEEKPYGGTILQLIFEAIMGNFHEETCREDAVMVQLVTTLEDILLDYGVLEHDHVFMVCRRPA